MVKTNDAVKDGAEAVVAFMTQLVDSQLNSFASLLIVARNLECEVFVDARAVASYAVNDDETDSLGIITVCLDGISDTNMVRQLAHELAHHILHYWDRWRIHVSRTVAESLGQVAESHNLEELVCRSVADTICALPGGLQWNGKLAIPRTGPQIRWYNARPIPSFMEMSQSDLDEMDGRRAKLAPRPLAQPDPERERAYEWLRERRERQRFSDG